MRPNWLGEKKGISLRLPTEDEWYRLVDFCDVKDETDINRSDANINLEHFASTVPVSHFNHNGFYDIIGNVWQWSQTPIYPYENFEIDPLYDDFSTPTFDIRHNLIKGGSWISTGNQALLSSRYAFRRHFYQHAGFRYVQSQYEEKASHNIYESDALIAQYIDFSWGKPHLGLLNYAENIVTHLLPYLKDRSLRELLDVGCAVGRSSFELARYFDKVTAVDFSARFIQTAIQMQKVKKLYYTMPQEGELYSYHQVSMPKVLSALSEKITFLQADACNLKPTLHGYDCVFASNLIDRLYDPEKFLNEMAKRLNEEGVLILTSPYTWLEEFTPKERWIGGYKEGGKNITTLEGLEKILGKDFRLLGTHDIPFAIKETARKHQYTIAQMTIWEKKRS